MLNLLQQPIIKGDSDLLRANRRPAYVNVLWVPETVRDDWCILFRTLRNVTNWFVIIVE